MSSEFINEINKVVDYSAIDRGFVVRDGFMFESIRHPGNVYNAIVVRNPPTARYWGENRNRFMSPHSLEDHIAYINKYKLDKAQIIAEDLSFLKKCPSLKHIDVIPAESVEDDFDYSPLYEHPEIQSILCVTHYGPFDQRKTSVDYSMIKGLIDLNVRSKEDLNYNTIQSLKSLDVWESSGRNIPDYFCSKDLDTLQLTSCGIRSLDGIGISSRLQCLYLYYNRSLHDISGLEEVSQTIRALRIQNCPKIQDFSVIGKLTNLEYLFLEGGNKLPSLAFLNNLKKIKTFILKMEVLDGDLTPCMGLSYVHCGKVKRYYNIRSKDLPKGEFFRGNDNIELWRRVI